MSQMTLSAKAVMFFIMLYLGNSVSIDSHYYYLLTYVPVASYVTVDCMVTSGDEVMPVLKCWSRSSLRVSVCCLQRCASEVSPCVRYFGRGSQMI